MNEKILIIGGGRCAWKMAEALLQSKIPVVMACSGESGAASLTGPDSPEAGDLLEIIDGARIRSCIGSAGRFTVEWTALGKRIQREVRRIIVAEDPARQANFSFYGLKESPGVMSLSGLRSILNSEPGAAPFPESVARAAFLNGVFYESLPVISEEVMTAALCLQRDFGIQTYIFTGNLKVAGDGLEALCRLSKEAGTVFVKSTGTAPKVDQAADGTVSITYTDEVLGQGCLLAPDLTIVDEAIAPAGNWSALADILGLELGPDGFMQADNVHRLPTFTNRKGSHVVGPVRGISTPFLLEADIAHIASGALPESETDVEKEGRAQIDTGKCIRCLTCLRICPYRAVALFPRPVVLTEGCEACGICVAECPCCAITLPSLTVPVKAFDAETAAKEPADSAGAIDDVPSLTVFCCTRSAIPARDLAKAMGCDLPEKLTCVEVPCAGAVSQSQLLDALARGADGVLVLGCHADNCHSDRGTLLARNRVAQIGALMPALGLPVERLAFRSLAANMGAEFSTVIRDFMATLESLRALPVKIENGA